MKSILRKDQCAIESRKNIHDGRVKDGRVNREQRVRDLDIKFCNCGVVDHSICCDAVQAGADPALRTLSQRSG
jgi:hypothetical protein